MGASPPQPWSLGRNFKHLNKASKVGRLKNQHSTAAGGGGGMSMSDDVWPLGQSSAVISST